MNLPLPKQITNCFQEHEKTKVKNLLICSQAIFEARTTNLNKVKDKLGQVTGNKSTQPQSNYKRLIRFFQTENKEELIQSLLFLSFWILRPRRIKYLTLDGTAWEFGQKKIHVLALCIVYGGVSIPIWWEDLDKKGTSDFKERKAVIEQASRFLNLKGLILLADREYIGRQWLAYLKSKAIDFIIRLKEKVYKEHIDPIQLRVGSLDLFQKARYIKLQRLAQLKKYRTSGVSKVIQMNGENYTFVVFKNPKPQAKEPLLYFISSLEDRPKIIKAYPIRWSIECCFKHLKSNGFNMEEMGLKNPDKVKLMIAILVFLYVLCIREGIEKTKKSTSNIWKKYKNGKKTLAVSFFRKGLSWVQLQFSDLRSFIRYLKLILSRRNWAFLLNVQ